MNNFFSLNRFGKYFAYDIVRAKNSYGWSMLICCCSTVVYFLFSQFFSLVTTGHVDVVAPEECFVRLAVVALVAVTIFLTLPLKLYGVITEKRVGSNFLMIPASAFEKVLSMVLICCVIAPVVYIVAVLGVDAIFGLVCPATYGAPLITSDLSRVRDLVGLSTFKISMLAFWNWVQWMLIMLLGTVIFRKHKILCTILSLMALWTVFFSFLSLFANIATGENFIALMERIGEMGPESIEVWVKAIAASISIVTTIAILVGIYFRVKTIKQ